MLITAQGEFMLKDLRRGLLFAAKRVWCSIFVIELLAMGTVYFLSSTGNIDRALLINIFIWLPLLVAVMAFLVFFRSYRMKRKSPALQGIIRYEFDDSGIKLAGDYSSTEIRWPAVIKWRANKSTLLMYATPHLANIIPKRFFNSVEDVTAVQNLFRTHVSTKKN
jgi:hypothetical protein